VVWAGLSGLSGCRGQLVEAAAGAAVVAGPAKSDADPAEQLGVRADFEDHLLAGLRGEGGLDPGALRVVERQGALHRAADAVLVGVEEVAEGVGQFGQHGVAAPARQHLEQPARQRVGLLPHLVEHPLLVAVLHAGVGEPAADLRRGEGLAQGVHVGGHRVEGGGTVRSPEECGGVAAGGGAGGAGLAGHGISCC
jgi:hypothetical protein